MHSGQLPRPPCTPSPVTCQLTGGDALEPLPCTSLPSAMVSMRSATEAGRHDTSGLFSFPGSLLLSVCWRSTAGSHDGDVPAGAA